MELQQRRLFFRRLKRRNPTPTTELKYASEFELLIAVILSAQATDVSVNKATAKLYAQASTPETILALGEDGLIELLQSLAGQSVETMLEAMILQLSEFAGADQFPDDISGILFEFRGKGP